MTKRGWPAGASSGWVSLTAASRRGGSILPPLGDEMVPGWTCLVQRIRRSGEAAPEQGAARGARFAAFRCHIEIAADAATWRSVLGGRFLPHPWHLSHLPPLHFGRGAWGCRSSTAAASADCPAWGRRWCRQHNRSVRGKWVAGNLRKPYDDTATPPLELKRCPRAPPQAPPRSHGFRMKC